MTVEHRPVNETKALDIKTNYKPDSHAYPVNMLKFINRNQSIPCGTCWDNRTKASVLTVIGKWLINPQCFLISDCRRHF